MPRGRPRKSTENSAAPTIAAASTTPVEKKKTKKALEEKNNGPSVELLDEIAAITAKNEPKPDSAKKRGRKPKEPAPAAAAAAAVEDKENAASSPEKTPGSAKKRGRPSAAADKENAVKEAENEKENAPKKRGRKPKEPEQAEDEQEKSATEQEDSSAEPVQIEAAAPEVQSATPGKKRGRPSTTTSQTPVEDEASEEVSAAAAAAAGEDESLEEPNDHEAKRPRRSTAQSAVQYKEVEPEPLPRSSKKTPTKAAGKIKSKAAPTSTKKDGTKKTSKEIEAEAVAKIAPKPEPAPLSSFGNEGMSMREKMEAIRKKNIEEKMEMLKSLGLFDAKDKLKKSNPTSKEKVANQIPANRRVKRVNRAINIGERRRSNRKSAVEGVNYKDLEEDGLSGRRTAGDFDWDAMEDDDSDTNSISAEERKAVRKSLKSGKSGMNDVMVSDTSLYKYQKNPDMGHNFFGAVPGIPMGEHFISRMEANYAGVHRPTVAGISGSAAVGGAFSICISGGGDYSEDLDFGEMFTFSGAGGRDLKGTKANPKNLRTAAQSRDQELTGVNLALSMNVDSGEPVRVIRGFKGDPKYSPKWGYRYDGLYRVMEWRWVRGQSGFKVITFAFKRLEDQEPAPWTNENEGACESSDEEDEEDGEKVEEGEGAKDVKKEETENNTGDEEEVKNEESKEENEEVKKEEN